MFYNLTIFSVLVYFCNLSLDMSADKIVDFFKRNIVLKVLRLLKVLPAWRAMSEKLYSHKLLTFGRENLKKDKSFQNIHIELELQWVSFSYHVFLSGLF